MTTLLLRTECPLLSRYDFSLRTDFSIFHLPRETKVRRGKRNYKQKKEPTDLRGNKFPGKGWKQGEEEIQDEIA